MSRVREVANLVPEGQQLTATCALRELLAAGPSIRLSSVS